MEGSGQCAAERPSAEALSPHLRASLSRLEQLERRFDEALEAAKLEAMAEFAAGAGHEINNPLAIISGRAQLLLQGEADAERRRELSVIAAQAFRVYEMIADMMLFARPPRPVFAPVDLSELIDRVIESLAAKAQSRQSTLRRTDRREPVRIVADRTQLIVAVRALCENALAAVGDHGRVELATEIVIDPTNDVSTNGPSPEMTRVARLEVRDHGSGITPEVRRNIFDPFYSGRAAGRGLGLGLSKCWRIVKLHGGHIDVQSEVGQGTTFTVLLPLAPTNSMTVALHPSGFVPDH